MNQETLKAVIHYCPDTGVFTWRNDRAKRAKAGSVAGWKDARYWRIKVEGKSYLAHRLAFLYITGEWPPNHVDHENKDCFDNRWENLRSVTRSENHRNRKLHHNSKSGVSGVKWHDIRKKWHVYINNNELKRQHIGSFDSLLDAVAARMRAEREFGYHKNHGSTL